MILCSLALATIGLHTVTIHDRPGYEFFTPGIYAMDTEGCVGGVLRNSEGRAGAYLGKNFDLGKSGFSVAAVVLTGYSRQRFVPGIIGSYKIGDARIMFWPANPSKGSAGGIHLAWEWKL